MSRPVWQMFAGRLARIFGIRFYDMYLARRDFSPSAEPSVRRGPCGVRLATDRDLETIAGLLAAENRHFDHYRSFGSRCYVADQEGKIAGCLWVNHHVVKLKGMCLAQVPAGHAFTHGAFVLPEFRGQRIYRYLRATVCAELYRSGFESVACLVDKANHLSIRVLRQEGMEFYSANILKLPGVGPILFCRVLA